MVFHWQVPKTVLRNVAHQTRVFHRIWPTPSHYLITCDSHTLNTAWQLFQNRETSPDCLPFLRSFQLFLVRKSLFLFRFWNCYCSTFCSSILSKHVFTKSGLFPLNALFLCLKTIHFFDQVASKQQHCLFFITNCVHNSIHLMTNFLCVQFFLFKKILFSEKSPLFVIHIWFLTGLSNTKTPSFFFLRFYCWHCFLWARACGCLLNIKC